ncbi:MAG: thioredoxin family protein [Planctomycetes bacterium]|nr:thioredoxin family protein [Planctomycetota bacterium]
MKRIALSLAGCLAFPALAWGQQQPGGRIQWRGGEEYDAAMAEAKKYGRPILLYFWAEWAAPCHQHDRGVFSDDAVVKASEKFVRILVDYKKHPKIMTETWKINGIPTFFFLDPDGNKVDGREGVMPSDNPDTLVSHFNSILEKHGRFPRWADTLEAALEKGRRDRMPVILFWTDGKEASEEYARSFGSAALKDLLRRFVWVRLKLVKKGNPAVARYAVKGAPLLLVIDPRDDAPLVRCEGVREPEALRAELDAALGKVRR